MKNKKLFAAALTAALAVSMMGTYVMAATPSGTTEFSYTPGTAGPTVPVNPADPENDPNNWMVSYPRSIVLMDNNESDLTNSATKGQELTFKVKQRVAGTDGDKVTANNVGAGITVAAGGWASGTDILMTASSGNSEVNMNLANAAGDKFLAPAETMMTLTHTADTDAGFAVIKKGDVKTAVEGVTYTKDVTFTFTKG